MNDWLLYGATGYTGELVAREAVRRGLSPVIAGRSPARVAPLAAELGLPWRAFELTSPEEVASHLDGVALVLHCAGPFLDTYHPVIEACLRRGCHYLDITGEIPVIEAIAARDAAARAAGVVLLPGAGFDVVPSDCLAVHLARRLPAATSLQLAFAGTGGISRGTLRSALRQAGRGGLVRRAGVLVPHLPSGDRLDVDFGHGRLRPTVRIPWGDLATAWRSTGIADIETRLAPPASALSWLTLFRLLLPLLGTRGGARAAERWIARRPPGPSAEARRRGRSWLWGRATSPAGEAAEALLAAPEAYRLTALAAVHLVVKMRAQPIAPGYQTPASAFGPDLVLELPEVERRDLP